MGYQLIENIENMQYRYLGVSMERLLIAYIPPSELELKAVSKPVSLASIASLNIALLTLKKV